MISHFQVSLTSEAEEDLSKIVDWYDSIDTKITDRFLNDFEKTINILSKTPFIYQEHFLFIRKSNLSKFPFKIFYVADEIDYETKIIAILHEKQDPQVIKKRINFE